MLLGNLVMPKRLEISSHYKCAKFWEILQEKQWKQWHQGHVFSSSWPCQWPTLGCAPKYIHVTIYYIKDNMLLGTYNYWWVYNFNKVFIHHYTYTLYMYIHICVHIYAYTINEYINKNENVQSMIIVDIYVYCIYSICTYMFVYMYKYSYILYL